MNLKVEKNSNNTGAQHYRVLGTFLPATPDCERQWTVRNMLPFNMSMYCKLTGKKLVEVPAKYSGIVRGRAEQQLAVSILCENNEIVLSDAVRLLQLSQEIRVGDVIYEDGGDRRAINYYKDIDSVFIFNRLPFAIDMYVNDELSAVISANTNPISGYEFDWQNTYLGNQQSALFYDKGLNMKDTILFTVKGNKKLVIGNRGVVNSLHMKKIYVGVANSI
jgi:hypothetical protein